MTRGIIVYIDINGEYCVSTEFNGDMHSYSHGLEIIDKYKNRKLVTKSDYVKFVSAFDRKHFRYGNEGDVLVHYGKIEDDRLDLTRLYPDYFYIINHSGNKISFTCRSNTFELDDQAMTITHFETVDRVVKMDPSNNPMITKRRFVEIMKCLNAAHDFSREFNDLIYTYHGKFNTDYIDGPKLAISHDELVIELLEAILNDKGDMIDYFIHKMDFGRKSEPEDTLYENGREINISTAENLYDYLTSKL